MKRLILICSLMLAGCDKPQPKVYNPPGVVPMVMFEERRFGYSGSLWFCTNGGHRFAIAMNDHGAISICEVTDASNVEPK